MSFKREKQGWLEKYTRQNNYLSGSGPDFRKKFDIKPGANIKLTKPLSYIEFLNLWKDAKVALTDSGGLQEETTALGIPCLTIRDNTERPITVTQGTNELMGTSKEKILGSFKKIINNELNKNMAIFWSFNPGPELWKHGQ